MSAPFRIHDLPQQRDVVRQDSVDAVAHEAPQRLRLVDRPRDHVAEDALLAPAHARFDVSPEAGPEALAAPEARIAGARRRGQTIGPRKLEVRGDTKAVAALCRAARELADHGLARAQKVNERQRSRPRRGRFLEEVDEPGRVGSRLALVELHVQEQVRQRGLAGRPLEQILERDRLGLAFQIPGPPPSSS